MAIDRHHGLFRRLVISHDDRSILARHQLLNWDGMKFEDSTVKEEVYNWVHMYVNDSDAVLTVMPVRLLRAKPERAGRHRRCIQWL